VAAGKDDRRHYTIVRTLTWRLKAIRDMPARIPTKRGNSTLVQLAYTPEHEGGGRFHIKEVKPTLV